MDMDQDFGEWYRIASLDCDGDTLKNRWEGITKILDMLDDIDPFDIVRVFFNHKAKAQDFLQLFKNVFFGIDPKFRMQNNEQEIRVLCGALITQILKTSRGNQIGLATVCMDLKGLVPPPPIKNVVERAQDFLIQSSKELRAPSQYSEFNTPNLISSKLTKGLQDAGTKSDFQTGAPILEKAIKSFIDKTNTLQSNQSKLYDILQLQQEELNILWWVFGEVSNTLKKHFSKIDISTCSLISGKELADLTIFVPGSFGAEAYLNKVLRISKPKKIDKLKFIDTIDTAKKDLNEYWNINNNPEAIDLCPIHKAVSISIELDDKINWPLAFNKIYTIDLDKDIKAIDLAVQIYQESLFLKTL